MKIFFLYLLILFATLKSALPAENEQNIYDRIANPPIDTTEKSNVITKALDSLSFEAYGASFILIPIFQNNKDLGSSYGIMPISAIKAEGEENPIKFVIAPSYYRNKKLGDTFSYRHYYFPTSKSIVMGRISSSSRAQREAVFWYYMPIESGKIDIYAYDYKDPKYSFYGYGPDSSKSDKANYIFFDRGIDTTFSFPFSKKMIASYSVSLYKKRVENGLFSDLSIKDAWPKDYEMAHLKSDFLTNKIGVSLDTTDHPFLPKLGNFISFSFLFSVKPYSDYSYSLYSIESKKYYNYARGKHVTAVRYLLEWQTGDKLPFYENRMMGESSGMRMAGDGRFNDRAKFLATIEQRITLSRCRFMKFISELEFTPFLDIGTVAPSVDELKINKLKYGPGASLRIILRPHIVATSDIAFGSEGYNFLVKVGYPF